MMYWLALADIDPQYILKTAHKMAASYSEAFLHRGYDDDVVKLGLFSEQ